MNNKDRYLEEISKYKKEIEQLKKKIKEIENNKFVFQEGRVRVSEQRKWERDQQDFLNVWCLGIEPKRLDYDSTTKKVFQNFSYAKNLENIPSDIDDLIKQLTVVKNSIISAYGGDDLSLSQY